MDESLLNDLLNDLDDDWEKSSLNTISGRVLDFNRYEIIELIAKGGMKEVYKAFDKQNGRHIALAKLRRDVPEEQTEDFLKEAYLTAKLVHPNIISLHDIGVDDEGFPFFTMELKVGDTLATILEKRENEDETYLQSFPIDKKLEIFLKICDAISYSHSCGVIHLDIKPDNIQVGKFGEVQVCDWGLGTKIDEQISKADDKFIKGTPGYMAPEQIDPKASVGVYTDIYMLGALLYSLLTDSEPVAGGLNTILQKTLTGEIQDLNSKRPDLNISASISAVVSKAMDVEIEHRYSSVEQLKAEVEAFLSGRSTEAENADFLKEALLFYKRNTVVCLLIFSFVAIFSVTASHFLYELNLSNKNLQISYENLQKANQEKDKNHQLYREKVDAEKKLTDELIKKSYTEDIQQFEGKAFYTNKSSILIKSADDMLEHYRLLPKNKIVRRRTIEILFMLQRFDEIAQFEGKSNFQLVDIAKKYAAIKERRKGLLMIQDFQSLLKDLNACGAGISHNFMERVVHFYFNRKEKLYATEAVVKELIKSANSEWDYSKFEYNAETQTLKVWGNNLKYLRGNTKNSTRASFVRYLNVKKLIIGKSKITSLYLVGKLNIFTLDVSEASMNELKELQNFPNLNRVIITKRQLLKNELKSIRSDISIEQI